MKQKKKRFMAGFLALLSKGNYRTEGICTQRQSPHTDRKGRADNRNQRNRQGAAWGDYHL